MKKFVLVLTAIIMATMVSKAIDFEKDIIKTSKGDLIITFIAHGTLMMEFDGKIIHIDPVGMYADYSQMPKADLILITHEHKDHFDLKAVKALGKSSTMVVLTETCAQSYRSGKIMVNGGSSTITGIKIDAVPAYNFEKAFHPKGKGNGYVLTFGDKKVYVAGDTENIPEMANLKNIDVAFLPMNQPYTMTPKQVADAAVLFSPKILYPYHFGDTNTDELIDLMKYNKDIEVRIRRLP
jgi:L-ascorbate metabolism protein UlaG (beta-lactamase superfamily)